MLAIVLTLFILSCAGDESFSNDFERAKASGNVILEKMKEMAAYKAKYPYNPFIRLTSFSSGMSLFPKMKFLLVTTDRAYPTKCLYLFIISSNEINNT